MKEMTAVTRMAQKSHILAQILIKVNKISLIRRSLKTYSQFSPIWTIVSIEKIIDFPLITEDSINTAVGRDENT